MLTTPILIDVAVTPRNDAVSAAGAVDAAPDADEADDAAGDDVAGAALAGGAAFLPLPPQAARPVATMTTTATNGGTRTRPTSPPLRTRATARPGRPDRSPPRPKPAQVSPGRCRPPRCWGPASGRWTPRRPG